MSAANPTPFPPAGGSPDSSSNGLERAIDVTARLATSWVGEVAGYVAAVGAAVYEFQKLGPALKGFSHPVQVAIVTAPLVLALLLQGIPKIMARRRKRWLAKVPGHLQPGYFQLAPRDEEAKFVRADGKHLEVLKWVDGSKSQVLYLTGLSGSGKTSLLAAWVLPNLRRKNTLVIRLRGYQDPVTVLDQELQRPGVVWQKPDPQRDDIRSLLERASRHVRPKRLLIVFDQFEEFVILRDASQQQRFDELMSLFREHPRGDITFLFVFRSDYIGLVEKLSLPSLRQDTNWQEIPPFTETAAREFMRNSGLPASDELQGDVLREAAEIEQTKGLIRPITINLCGLVLGRFATGLPRSFRPGQLIRGFLRESIFLPPIRDLSPHILPHLISGYVTRRPRTLNDLARETALDPGAIRGCLRLLGSTDRAIVHPLDADQQTWEISHDFLVPLLDSILARSTASLWRRFRAWLPWIVAAGLLVVSATMPFWMKGLVIERIFQAKVFLCRDNKECIVDAISSLPRKVPSTNDSPSEVLYEQQELGEFVRSSDASMKILSTVYGIKKERFLGTGFSMPPGQSLAHGEHILEYLVPNYPERHPGVLVWKLEPKNDYLNRTLSWIINNVPPANLFAENDLDKTRAAMNKQLLEDTGPAVVRFASIPPGKYSGCLGRPEAHMVFASHLGMMSHLTVEQGNRMSGSTPQQSSKDELYMFVFVPARADELGDPTWAYMISNLEDEVHKQVECPQKP